MLRFPSSIQADFPLFKDYFSKQSRAYAEYRPRYPQALFEKIAQLAPATRLAWDCATGNGQAALGLAEYFDDVIATDASHSQITNAYTHPRVQYRTEPAESTKIESNSIDAIVVAQAIHWFDITRFFIEANRVMRNDSIIAVCSYCLLQISSEIDSVINHFYYHDVGAFWPPERSFIEDEYQSIQFPFNEVTSPRFEMHTQWTLHQLLGYFNSWSAVQAYKEYNNKDPLTLVSGKLLELWGNPSEPKKIAWPLAVRIGRK